MAFTSDPSTHRQCFEVNITDDRVLEETEIFRLRLTLAEGSSISVNINPNTSDVEIIDDDGETIQMTVLRNIMFDTCSYITCFVY